jgi:hypothetical protein
MFTNLCCLYVFARLQWSSKLVVKTNQITDERKTKKETKKAHTAELGELINLFEETTNEVFNISSQP